MPIREYSLTKALQGLGINFEEVKYTIVYFVGNQFVFCLQFTDLCILLGCDYCDSIKGIGQKRALDLIKQHRNIETILKNIDKKVNNEDLLLDFLLFKYRFIRNMQYRMIGLTNKPDNCLKCLKSYQLMRQMFVQNRFYSFHIFLVVFS